VAHTSEAGPGEPLGERLRWAGHQAAASLLLLPLLSLRRAAYRHEARLAAILLRRRRLAARARALARAIVPPLGWTTLGCHGGQDDLEELEVEFCTQSTAEEAAVRLLLLDEATVIFVQVLLLTLAGGECWGSESPKVGAEKEVHRLSQMFQPPSILLSCSCPSIRPHISSQARRLAYVSCVCLFSLLDYACSTTG
jgi:hypothetical protein